MRKSAGISALTIAGDAAGHQAGFSVLEFILSSLVLLVIAASSFGVLVQTDRTAGTQTQIQSVTDNARMAMETLTRIIQQAGNDPLHSGFKAIIITSETQLRVLSDVTGSAITVSPDKGDPDGDIQDAGEDIIIRYDEPSRTIQLLIGPNVQPIAGNVSAFSMQYFDRDGFVTAVGDDVRRVRITLTVTSPLPDPQTQRAFSMQLRSEVQIASRQ